MNLFVNVNKFTLYNGCNKKLKMKIYVNDSFMISQTLKPREESPPIFFSNSIKGAISFLIIDLDTNIKRKPISQNIFLYDHKGEYMPLKFHLWMSNDIFRIFPNFPSVSHIRYENKSNLQAQFKTYSNNRLLNTSKSIGYEESIFLNLKSLGVKAGYILSSSPLTKKSHHDICKYEALYNPYSIFCAVYRLYGNSFKATFMRIQ